MADHADAAVDTTTRPQFRLRINTGRNSSGVTFDATFEMTWSGDADTYYFDGEPCPVEVALAQGRRQVDAALADRIADAKAYDTYLPKPGK